MKRSLSEMRLKRLYCAICKQRVLSDKPHDICVQCGRHLLEVGVVENRIYMVLDPSWWMNSSHIGIGLILLLLHLPAAVFVETAFGGAWLHTGFTTAWVPLCVFAMALARRRARCDAHMVCGNCGYTLLTKQSVCPECGHSWWVAGRRLRVYSRRGEMWYMTMAALALAPILVTYINVVYRLLNG